jgi:two-component sensor histidine kinase
MAKPDGHIFWYNSRWYEYTGATPTEQQGWGWQVAHDPQTLPTVLSQWRHSLSTGEPFEMTFPLRGADGVFRPFLTRAVPAKDELGNIVRWFGMNTDVTAQHEYEQHLQLLIEELNHRVKNTLAVVQSLASQSFRAPVDLQSARRAFEARLLAMSAAHNLLTQETWKGAWIGDVLRAALSPFVNEQKRIALSGPAIWIPPKMVLALSMALHELGTNATKYGALSNQVGMVAVDWDLYSSAGDKRLQMTWTECGGPAVREPAKRGFGSQLVEHGLASDLRGKVDLQYRPEGLICRIEAPIADASKELQACIVGT